MFKLHNYQEYAKDFIIKNKKCGLFLDMGLGKTVTSLTAIDILMNDYLDVGKVLVIAPKNVAENTWTDEIQKWDHLRGLKVKCISGTAVKRRKALDEEADIYTISRDNVVWLVDELKKDWKFDTLIIDELSSFKNPSSKRFKKLKTVTPFFDRVIGLTGTPAPNSYMDLWSQIYLLDRGERLGKNITAFRRQFFNAYSRGMYVEYELKEGAKEKIDDLISDICVSMKSKDYLKDLKEPIIIDYKVKLDNKEFKLYRDMAKEAVAEVTEKDKVVALSAAVVTNKLLQMANGTVYGDDKKPFKIHERKLETLDDILEQAQNENILVFYNFQSDLENILSKFPEAKKFEGSEDIRNWNSGKIKMLLLHPASAGHGLNLQQGGSIIVWYGLTWSLELYLQANARLVRQGQKEVVRIYRLVTEHTVDERVIETLNGKKYKQDELLEKLKADLL
ncbi:DEAD/DEAH box helicase [uncultured Parvimonas sp.]|uniref:DEAD/DEAH box helicase n=1 Tax=uncultured Parvimonas sp. TaxID=747372 RepID=UPI00206C777A|nr:MAG TPA: Chromatin remodeling complex ATPase [Caudoviricetes sp.]